MAAPTARTPTGETPEKSHSREIHDRSSDVEQPSKSKLSANSTSTIQRYWVAIKWYLLDQWFLLAVSLGIIISSQVQIPEAHQHQKETVVTYLCVSIIFLVTGCTLSTRTLLQNYSKWKIHLFVQVQCYLLTSVLAFGIVSACATNPEFMDSGLLIGLILMGCVPTTIASNVVMTRQAHGNQALTVVESTLGNFLGPFLTPVLLRMYTSSDAWYTKVLPEDSGGFAGVYRRVFMQLGLSLFLPLVGSVGHLGCWMTLLTRVPGCRPNNSKLVSWADTEGICPTKIEQNRLNLPRLYHMVCLRSSLSNRCLHQCQV